MKNRVIGLLIYFFFIFGVIAMEGGSLANLLLPPLLITLGATAGLSLMYYKKGMDRNTFLKRVKKYFIFTGFIGTLSSIVMILSFAESATTLNHWFARISNSLQCLVYGYFFAFITDTFID